MHVVMCPPISFVTADYGFPSECPDPIYFLLAWATYVKFGVSIWEQDYRYVAAVRHSGKVVLVKLAYIWKLTLQLMLKFTLK